MATYSNSTYSSGPYGGIVSWTEETVTNIETWAEETVTNIETWVSVLVLLLSFFITGSAL